MGGKILAGTGRIDVVAITGERGAETPRAGAFQLPTWEPLLVVRCSPTSTRATAATVEGITGVSRYDLAAS